MHQVRTSAVCDIRYALRKDISDLRAALSYQRGLLQSVVFGLPFSAWVDALRYTSGGRFA